MAITATTRIEALDMLNTAGGKAMLAELYGQVIENVEKGALSNIVKNRNLSGNPTSGSVEAKRFENAQSKDYGTARTAGKGEALKIKPVTIKINIDKEFVEELEKKDVSLLGVTGVMENRAINQTKGMIRELDAAFFATAKAAALADGDLTKSPAPFVVTGTKVSSQLESTILSLESTKNEFVDGVDRSDIFVFLDPQTYSKLRDELDKDVNNANINTAVAEMGMFHGCVVMNNLRMPAGTTMITMHMGAVAQPVMSDEYTAEKIGLSNAYGVSLFYSYGTEAVTPDLIRAVYTTTEALRSAKI